MHLLQVRGKKKIAEQSGVNNWSKVGSTVQETVANMVKLGKKKELSRNKSDSEGRRKNGAAPDRASEEENNAVSEEQAERGSNGDNASRASNSSGSDSKRATKRKAKSSERSGSNDSDDLPLNGSTTAAKKARKTAKPKAPAAAAKNGKKAASKRAENDAEDDEELADSNDEAGPSDAEEVEYEVGTSGMPTFFDLH